MEVKYDVKFEVTDEDKLEIYTYAYHLKFMLAVVLLLLAGIVGVAVTWHCGWKYGIAAFMLAYAIVLMLADGMFVVFMSRGINRLVKRKMENQES